MMGRPKPGSRRQMGRLTACSVRVLALFVLALMVGPVAAATEYEKHADGLAIYLGVLPAELLRGAGDRQLAAMHGGTPSARDTHHIVVSVFEDASGTQVRDAKVEARVGSLGLAGTRRTLDPMMIGNTTTYGNFFPMAGPGPYIIEMTVRREG